MEKSSEQKKPVAAVLMSTYNGARYLKEQVDSILAQQGVSVLLCVRDDGSSDDTPGMLRRMQADGQLSLLPSDRNLGFAESFWTLVLNAPEADYYAYSDQDDVWLPEKLSRAVRMLEEKESTPCLYVSGSWQVDGSLARLPEQLPPVSLDGMSRAAFIVTQTSALGHNMVWNRALQRQLCAAPDCIWASEHDHRLQFAAAMLGEIVTDPERTALHRLHGRNASGGDGLHSALAYGRVRLGQIRRRLFGDDVHRHSLEIRAGSFLQHYGGQVSPPLREALQLAADYRKSPAATLRLLRSDACANVPKKVIARILLHLL